MSETEATSFRDVFDAVDAGLVTLDRSGSICAWNTWMERASGVARTNAIGKRIDRLFPELAGARLPTAIEDALQAGASSLLTHALHPRLFPLFTRAGRELIHNIAVKPLGAGRERFCLIQITDVTVVTERERVLRHRHNARYDAVVDSAPDAILTLDAEGVIQLANPSAAREFGYPEGALIGQPAAVLFQDQPAWVEAWATALAGGSLPRPVELVGKRRDGSESHVEISASRWCSDGRRFVTAILRDVNERRAAEEALKALNRTLEMRVAERTADRDRMWRLSSDIMLVARLDGVIHATNPAWTEILGWSEPVLLGHRLQSFSAEADRPVLEAELQKLREEPSSRRFETRMQMRTGGKRWIAWSAAAGDNLLHAVGRDITTEREVAEALKQTEEALRQSQKMEAIGQLTGGIAHDFNNLLTGIIGAVDILKRRIAARRLDDVDRFMDAATASAQRAAALTHRLLAFAKRQPLDPRPLDVNQLIRGLEELLRRTLGEQIRLEIRLAEGLWPALTDANQLENAILNLVLNARDAMPRGGQLGIETLAVGVSAHDRRRQSDMAPGDYTLISITDTGTGMSPETLAKAFDPFFTTKPIGQGTGLGLSMIYGFAKQSRGQVLIKSELGRGTRVELYLPRNEGAPSAHQPPGATEAPGGHGETVLVVEDDAAVRLLIAEVLRELGYACLEAGDGEAALPLIGSDMRLDLLVTDVGLPTMNGRQLAEIARQHRPGLKVLFVTGYAETATEHAGFLEPGMDMVTKPFALDSLARKIREMIAS